MTDERPERARRTDSGGWTFRGKTLFPFQERAADAIHAGKNVLVAAPTGAGKTLVADVAIAQALGEGRKVVYTSPIKALSNQKFRDFRADYGDERVGIMTGDVTIRADAPLLIMTTEIFRNTVFEDPSRLADFDFVVFDEVHYLDDVERGTVWEESILYAPHHVRVVALSATVPNVDELAAWIAEVRGREVEVVVERERPVPLVHKVWVPGRGPRALDELRRAADAALGADVRRRGRFRGRSHGPPRGAAAYLALLERSTGDLLAYLATRDLLPAIYFVFSRKDCESLARAHAGTDLLHPDARERLLARFDELAARYQTADAPSTRELRRLASRGVLRHHAGMLPIDKEIVERLFATGDVRLLFATETFALGVNMPARTVCFHALRKFDGIRVVPLKTRDYGQMAGRAGRQGIDAIGHVFAVYDARFTDARDVERLQEGAVEPVRSRFNLDYSSVLNLYDHVGERVVDAWLRSFARFHGRWSRSSKGGKPAAKAPPAGAEAGAGAGPKTWGGRAIEARLDVLKRFHYLDASGLTRKGRIASKISGYEIASTEAYELGILARCDAVDAAMLFAAVSYEARPGDEMDPSIRPLKKIAPPLLDRMARFREVERDVGLPDPVREPEFRIAGVVEAWAEGEDFAVLESMCTLAAGDLVRIFRMTIQMLRQTLHALPHGDPVVETLASAILLLDRDVVDAKRQLELG